MSAETHHPWHKFEIGLVTIEFETAFIVGAAESDSLFDAVFVTDANGLPCIPGETLAGVLRHALAGDADPRSHPLCRSLLGYQERDGGDASRLRVSFAHTHGQDNRPVRFRGAPTDDPVLAFLAAGVGRDHVRIGPHGAVHERGKFDELVVPAGARFTFELSLADNPDAKLHQLVKVLERAEIRVGGKSRRGMGRFSVKGLRTASFDLTNPRDLTRLRDVKVDIHEAWRSNVLQDTFPQLKTTPVVMETHRQWVEAKVKLTPIGTWMVGGGIPTDAEPTHPKGGAWDRVPLTERRITWHKQGGGEIGKVGTSREALPLVPGSAVKGSLRHRMAFHARRIQKQWLPTTGGTGRVDFTEEEKQLFGEVREGDEGLPGRVLFSDVHVDTQPRLVGIQHVSLDRFTQGPMDHLLYDEVALGGGSIEMTISVHPHQSITPQARQAFAAALDDLCKGRLAIGAGRGHGRFKGDLSWSDGGKWIGGQA